MSVGAIRPDPDVGENGGMLGLAQVRRAGEERRSASGRDNKALEEAEAERVVAGEPVHRLLLKQEHPVEAGALHRGQQSLPAAFELGV